MLTVASLRRPLLLVVVALMAALVPVGTRAAPHVARAEAAPLPVVGLPGYHVGVFASGSQTLFNPDSVLAFGDRLFVGYQNGAAHDGSDGRSSTIVEYDTSTRSEVRRFSVLGEQEGLRRDPATGLIWASENEDANGALDTIDPATGKVTPITISPRPPSGFDDIFFTQGKAFAVNANPGLGSDGVNHGPAVFQLQLSGSTATLTTVLNGDAAALDTTTSSPITLNLTDPDSLTADPAGDLVVVDQGGTQIVTVANPATPQQSVTRAPVGTALDDTEWVLQSNERMYIADSRVNVIYAVDFAFQVGTAYTTSEDLDDDTVAHWVGVLNQTTGRAIPVLIGVTKASGLAFGPKPAD
jgi:hypothetical protein